MLVHWTEDNSIKNYTEQERDASLAFFPPDWLTTNINHSIGFPHKEEAVRQQVNKCHLCLLSLVWLAYRQGHSGRVIDGSIRIILNHWPVSKSAHSPSQISTVAWNVTVDSLCFRRKKIDENACLWEMEYGNVEGRISICSAIKLNFRGNRSQRGLSLLALLC